MADEHDVGVGAVAEFRTAEAAHADDGDFGGGGGEVFGPEGGADFGPEGGFEDGIPHEGEAAADFLHGHEVEEVGGGDAGEFGAAEGPGDGDGFVGVVVAGCGPH